MIDLNDAVNKMMRVSAWRHFPLIAAFVLILGFMAGFYWRDSIRDAFCSSEQEHCTREWISATGGWIAIVFAYLTIRTMNRQTAEANRHQRENVELQILDKMAAARRVAEQCQSAERECRNMIANIDHVFQKQRHLDFVPRAFHRFVKEQIDANEIRIVNLTSHSPRASVERFLEMFEAECTAYEAAVKDENWRAADMRLAALKSKVSMAQNIFSAARNDAIRFVERWRSRVPTY